MAILRRKPGLKRNVACPLGHDDWRKRANGSHTCKECARVDSSRRMKVRRRDPAVVLHDHAKARAAYLLVPFTITVEDIRSAWPSDNKCPALGIDLLAGKGYSVDSSPTLDRVNDQWGYEPGNIAVLSFAANRAKGRMKAGELEKIAAWMRSRGLD